MTTSERDAKLTTLFLGGRVGAEALETLLAVDHPLEKVFIDPPHKHEARTEWQRIELLCQERAIEYAYVSQAALENWRRTTSSQYLMSFGFRRMIPRDLRQAVGGRAIGTHFAPLPRYRGFAPLNWAILSGEADWAISMFILADEVDAGNLVAQAPIRIEPRDDINTLLDKCLEELRQMLSQVSIRLPQALAEARPQDESQATYACARRPEDGRIDWRAPAQEIDRIVRALKPPFPGAYAYVGEEKLVITECEPISGIRFEGYVPGRVGRVDGKDVWVLCGEGTVLRIQELMVGDETLAPASLLKSPRQTLR